MKKLFSLVLAALLLMATAACGGGPASEPAAPSFVVVKPEDSSVAVSSEVIEEIPLERAFLTGLEKGPDYPEGKRITAVMLNNQPNARPQNGTSEAKILVELQVEYGVTRFMAIFEDYAKMPQKVGGLRSARDQFFQLIIPFRAFYVHEGPSHPSHPVNVMMNQYEYRDYDVQAAYYPIYTRDSSRSTNQYHWYDVSGDSVAEYVEQTEADPMHTYNSPIFDFVPYTEPPRLPVGGDAGEVAVTHNNSYISYFEYNPANGSYDMSQYGGGGVYPTTDNLTGQQLAFENVVVLFAPVGTWPNTAPENLPKYDYSVGGAGYYFSQGRYEPLIWRKGSPEQPLLLYSWDDHDAMVKVNTGKTYLAVVDDDLLADFDSYVKSGNAGQALEGAVVPDSEVNLAD